jgi:hypothetical protein
MIIRKILVISFFLFTAHISYGQYDSVNNNYLSLGCKSAGICFGNSNIYNGLRLNLWDKGLSFGDKESEMINGINISFCTLSDLTNGIQFGGITSQSKKMNGISIAGMYHYASKINGFATSFIVTSDTINGLNIGFLVGRDFVRIEGSICNGLIIGGIVGAGKINGCSLSFMHSYSKKINGFSVSVYNKTEELHGLQIGLLNYAGNNPKLFKWLPLINFHP